MKATARILAAVAGAALLAASAAAAAAPAVGDAYTYRLVNGYSKEVRGQLRLVVTDSRSAGVTLEVTPDKADAGSAHTIVVTPEGNWLRHLVESHGSKVPYEFASAYPAYVFPLEAGKSWSLRVKATGPGLYPNRSVRVDAKVIGRERISVPAGEFDTIRIQRYVYPGDAEPFLTETWIRETDWYEPKLGRSVRSERKSEWRDSSRCNGNNTCEVYGDWDIYELAEVSAAR